MKNSTKKPVKELIYTDEPGIARHLKSIDNSYPLMQAIFDAYNAIPGAKPLDTDSFRSIFQDLNTFLSGCHKYWYEQNFAEKHKAIGITPEKGMKLVDDQAPSLSNLEDAVNAFFDAMYKQNASSFNYETEHAFEVVDGELVRDQKFIDFVTERSKLYLETPEDFEIRDTLKTIGDGIVKLRGLVHSSVHSVDRFMKAPGLSNHDFDRLNEVLDVIYPYMGQGEFNIVPKVEFFRRLKTSR